MATHMRDGLVDDQASWSGSSGAAASGAAAAAADGSGSGSWGPTALKTTTEQQWRVSFVLMAAALSVCHAAATTPAIYATAALQAGPGGRADAALYGAAALSSWLIAPRLLRDLGSRNGLLAGMLACAAYAACLAAASRGCGALGGDEDCARYGVAAARRQLAVLAVGGSLLGGLGFGVVWPCAGAFFAAVVERVAEARRRLFQATCEELGEELERAVAAELASWFAVYVVASECAMKATFTALLRLAGLSTSTALMVYAGCALVAALVFLGGARDVRGSSSGGFRRVAGLGHGLGSAAVAQQKELERSSPLRTLLFACPDVAFGLSAAWVIANAFATDAVDADLTGVLAALSALVAAGVWRARGRVAATGRGGLGDRGGFVDSGGAGGDPPGARAAALLGSCCCLGVAAVAHWGQAWAAGVCADAAAALGLWSSAWIGFVIVAIAAYVLQGMALGCRLGSAASDGAGESSALVWGPLGSGADAGAAGRCCAAAAVGFALGAVGLLKLHVDLLAASAALSFPCLLLAWALKRREEARVFKQQGQQQRQQRQPPRGQVA